MLRKVGESAWPISEKDAVVSIKDASYPIPFPQGLEFNHRHMAVGISFIPEC